MLKIGPHADKVQGLVERATEWLDIDHEYGAGKKLKGWRIPCRRMIEPGVKDLYAPHDIVAR